MCLSKVYPKDSPEYLECLTHLQSEATRLGLTDGWLPVYKIYFTDNLSRFPYQSTLVRGFNHDQVYELNQVYHKSGVTPVRVQRSGFIRVEDPLRYGIDLDYFEEYPQGFHAYVYKEAALKILSWARYYPSVRMVRAAIPVEEITSIGREYPDPCDPSGFFCHVTVSDSIKLLEILPRG